jgi:hypothetical protein
VKLRKHTTGSALISEKEVSFDGIKKVVDRWSNKYTDIYGDRVVRCYNCKLKAKVVPLHAMKALGGRGCDQRHAPAAL